MITSFLFCFSVFFEDLPHSSNDVYLDICQLVRARLSCARGNTLRRLLAPSPFILPAALCELWVIQCSCTHFSHLLGKSEASSIQIYPVNTILPIYAPLYR